eukprot:COSAG01_NODE_13184_length_1623_cov_2.786089_2_plen_204_part_00
MIMDEVELRATGVITCTELFNDLVDKFCDSTDNPELARIPSISRRCKLQVVRAIGVSIVEQGTMYPPMELLLRHAIQYFDLSTQACSNHARDLDSAAILKEEMANLCHREQQLVAHVYLLSVLLDGNLTSDELRVFEELFADQFWMEHTHLKERMLDLSYRYRCRAEHITVDDLGRALDGQGWIRRGWSLGRVLEFVWSYFTR